MATTYKKGETPLKTAMTNQPSNTHVDVKSPKWTIHIFFDGTKNNIFNSGIFRGERFGHSEKVTKNYPSEVSYTNYFSNIALLYMTLNSEDMKNTESIYVEGAGTKKYETDFIRGAATAGGETGINDRCAWAFNRLKRICKVNKIPPSQLILNVYGFSRGAAWARHFCYKLKNDGGNWSTGLFSNTQDTSFKHVKINFVGIFDTVSSDGGAQYNDVKPLGLDIGKPEGINYIAHFTAQNEYRDNFPLTSIKKAIKDGIGFEISFPGAHSDLGGGYPEEYHEKKTLRQEVLLYSGRGMPSRWFLSHPTEYIDYNWFVKKGYYTKESLVINEHSVTVERDTDFHYQFMGYELMKYIATKKANYKSIYLEGVTYQNIKTYVESMKRRAHLGSFYTKCEAAIKNNYTKSGKFYVPLLDDTTMKAIYGKYIHNSLEYGSLANGGTTLNKEKVNGKPDITKPTRPLVTKGFR